jgi:hypothetical protein
MLHIRHHDSDGAEILVIQLQRAHPQGTSPALQQKIFIESL